MYNRQEHIKCAWQRAITGPLPHTEKHWLAYGIDYTVRPVEQQDTGGTLIIMTGLPPEAEQLVIRRVTPKTQETDLHNGARLPAELIESIGDKLTMEVQELAQQVLLKDDFFDITQTVNKALEDERNERISEIAALRHDLSIYNNALEHLIWFVEMKHGPLGGAIPFITESGEYLKTESGDFLVTA